VIRAGVIWNRRSHRNLRGPRTLLPEDVLDIVVEEPHLLAAGLRRFCSEGIELIIIDGGDGTVREVLTRLPEAYDGQIPRLAVLPNGKTNALALDIGVPLGTSLDQLLAAARSGRPTKRRRCLEIVRDGQASPELRGFLFGMGAFVRATELAQRNHGLGFFDSAAIGVTIAGAAWRTFLGDRHEPWREGDEAQLSFTERGGRWFLVLASTLKRFPLSLKPFGEPHEGLKVLSVEAPPKRLARAAAQVLQGRDPPWLAACGYRRDDLPAFEIRFPGHFVLDGEIFEGGALSIREGPELEWVIP
jgi:hypothetical protein